jgi:hypothetical protein
LTNALEMRGMRLAFIGNALRGSVAGAVVME